MKNTKTKIWCTIGPASRKPSTLRELARQTDGIRVNLSHTQADEALEIFKDIRKFSRKAVLIIDTQGKETRIGSFSGQLSLKKNQLVSVKYYEQAQPGDLYFSRRDIATHLKENDIFSLDDNMISLKVLEKPTPRLIRCRVLKGGTMSAPKNVRILKKYDPKYMLTARDKEVVRGATKYGYAWLALSYVNAGTDVKEARKEAGDKIKIMSKIETMQAVQNLNSIIKESDAISIDRNDLGTEIGYEKIPLVQKFVVSKCKKAGKPIFIATHLLESMVTKDKPLRSEANDIVNTVLDGVDGLILSSETAVGKNPTKIVRTLRNLAKQGEFILSKNKGGNLAELIERLEGLNYI